MSVTVPQLPFDDDREWVNWWIEDEEAEIDWDQWQRENVPGYDPSYRDRGVIEDEISE